MELCEKRVARSIKLRKGTLDSIFLTECIDKLLLVLCFITGQGCEWLGLCGIQSFTWDFATEQFVFRQATLTYSSIITNFGECLKIGKV